MKVKELFEDFRREVITVYPPGHPLAKPPKVKPSRPVKTPAKTISSDALWDEAESALGNGFPDLDITDILDPIWRKYGIEPRKGFAMLDKEAKKRKAKDYHDYLGQYWIEMMMDFPSLAGLEEYDPNEWPSREKYYSHLRTQLTSMSPYR